MPELVPVEVGACRCPGAPHPDGDIVFLNPELGFRGGMLAEATMLSVWSKMDTSGKVPLQTEASLELEAGLREVYIRFGVAEWNLVDDLGEPVPVNEATIREQLLTKFGRARPVGDKADTLYTSSVLDPLVARLSRSSRSSQPRASTSTSRSSRSSAKRPKLLKPSSTTTTDKAPASA